MANYHIGNKLMADKERIMSLEGQNAELCDRIAALEHEKMLRAVAEDELIHSQAYELAMKIARDMLEKERSVIREEESVRADREAEERLKEQFAALERRDRAVTYDEERVREEAEKLARDKELFEESKSSLEAGITARLKETDEKRRAEFAVRMAQAKEEARADLHARLGEALARALDKLKVACDFFCTDSVAYEKAISEFVEEASVIESTAVNELTVTLREAGSSAIRKDRFLQKLCRMTFGCPSEKKHAENKVSSLLDEFISNPDRARLSLRDEEKLKESRRLVEEYRLRKAALKMLEDGCRAEEDRKNRKKHAHHTQLTIGPYTFDSSVCNLLEPLYEVHRLDFFERSRVLCADGTPMRIVNREKHKTDHYYMINFLSQDLNLSLFEVSLRKADDNPEKLAGNGRGSEDILLLLSQWKHPDVLMTDGYAGYNASIRKLGVDHCCCNAHSRRNFEECESENRTVSLMGQSFYANITIAEKMIAEEGLTGKKKTDRRKELEQPIWKAFVAWALMEHAKAADGSAIKGALGYFLERRKELQMYLNHPEMPLTNNDCERQIREVVMGRKNYLFFQNHLAAHRGAMMYSFFCTCKLQGVNPEQWLTYVLEHIRTTPADQIYRLLPQYWVKNKLF